MNLNPFELRKNDFDVEELFNYASGWMDIKEEVLEKFIVKNPLLQNLERGYSEYGYLYLLMGINIEIDWRVAHPTGSYQGDMWMIGKDKNNRVYFLHTGYGSCSGCDLYHAAEICMDGRNAMQELQDDLKRSVREFENMQEFLVWFLADERRETEYWGIGEYEDVVEALTEAYGVEKECRFCIVEEIEQNKAKEWYEFYYPNYCLKEEKENRRIESMYGRSYCMEKGKLIEFVYPIKASYMGAYGYGYLLHQIVPEKDWVEDDLMNDFTTIPIDATHNWYFITGESRKGLQKILDCLIEQYASTE